MIQFAPSRRPKTSDSGAFSASDFSNSFLRSARERIFIRIMTKFERCVIATRESPLAMWQALHIQSVLRQRYPEADVELLGMTTRGD